MANVIKIKKSSLTGVVPSALTLGELAINTKDKKLFFLNDLGILQSFDLFKSQLTLKDLEEYVFSSTTYTLVSQTILQKMFNSSPNGAISVNSTTSYFFECSFSLSNMSALAGTFGFGFLGSATFTGLRYTAFADKSDALNAPSNSQITIITVASSSQIVTSSVITNGNAFIRGVIRINAGGTLIPAVSLSVASPAIVALNSSFKIVQIGTNTQNIVGAWS